MQYANCRERPKQDTFRHVAHSFPDAITGAEASAWLAEEEEELLRALTCAWKSDRLLTVWRGINTFTRNCLCSAFSGRAKPLMILEDHRKAEVSSS